MLDTMEQVNNNKHVNKQSTNILTKTQGGVWLGFAAWVSSTTYYIENKVDDNMFNNVYSKYF